MSFNTDSEYAVSTLNTKSDKEFKPEKCEEDVPVCGNGKDQNLHHPGEEVLRLDQAEDGG